MLTNRCSKCLQVKPIQEFCKCSKKLNGLRSWCKSCESISAKEWRIKNPDQHKENARRWRKLYPDRQKESNRQWQERYPEKFGIANKRWRKANPEKVRLHRLQADQKRSANVRDKLSRSMSSAIRKSLNRNKNGYHWESLVGYTCEELKSHIESKFVSGMSWDNRSEWHIDHVMPINSFGFESPGDPDFMKCWSLSNLQPLWAADNIRKSNKVIVNAC